MKSIFLRTVRQVKRQEGWRRGFLRFVQLGFGYHDFVLFKRDLSEPFQVRSPAIETEYRFITPDELPILNALVPPLRMQRMAGKMERGEGCLVALHQRAVVAYGWTAYPGTPTSRELPFLLRENEAYHWGAYCLPSFRSKGLVTAMRYCNYHFLQGRGIEHCYHLAERKNRPAIRVAEKLGARPIGFLRILYILSWKYQRYSFYDAANWPANFAS